jgi:thiol-disulfide isomerase/thioredoxin
LAVAVVVAVALLGAACASGPKDVGKPAPGFSLENVVDGRPPVELRGLRGTPVVLNFWGSWCEPCKKEMPDLQAVHEQLGDQVRFVGVDVDDSRRLARAFLTKVGVTYPSGYDPNKTVFNRYKLVGAPDTMLVGADGDLVAKHIGIISADELRDLIREHLPDVKVP